MRATVQTSRYLVSRTGIGDHAAFHCLYLMLGPSMLAAIRRDLPERGQAMHVLRATFHEVWWMAATDVRAGTQRRNIPLWVEKISRHRSIERRRNLDLIMYDQLPAGTVTMLTAMLADQDQWTRAQLATMLDCRDAARSRRRTPKPAHRPTRHQHRVYTFDCRASEAAPARWQVPTPRQSPAGRPPTIDIGVNLLHRDLHSHSTVQRLDQVI